LNEEEEQEEKEQEQEEQQQEEEEEEENSTRNRTNKETSLPISMSFISTDLDTRVAATTASNVETGGNAVIQVNRRISYSEVTERSTFFDDEDEDEDNSNDMETFVAAEEIQRHWRGRSERLKHDQRLLLEHEAEVELHKRTAGKHTEEGLVLIEQESWGGGGQSKMDQDILDRSKRRGARDEGRQVISASGSGGAGDSLIGNKNRKNDDRVVATTLLAGSYHSTIDTSQATVGEVDMVVRTFRRCLALLCQRTRLTPFKLFDVDNNGGVTRGEFRRAVVEYDFAMTEIEM
jgi:hypothetical protein